MEQIANAIMSISKALGGGTGITGQIIAYGGASAPLGWLDCNGQAVSRTTYSALFAVLSTSYGVGDGSTTFNLPDLRGRIPVGKNLATYATLGGVVGAETASNTHHHQKGATLTTQTGVAGSFVIGSGNDVLDTTISLSTLQPSQTVNYMVKY